MLSFCTRFHAHTFSRFFFVYDTSAYSQRDISFLSHPTLQTHWLAPTFHTEKSPCALRAPCSKFPFLDRTTPAVRRRHARKTRKPPSQLSPDLCSIFRTQGCFHLIESRSYSQPCLVIDGALARLDGFSVQITLSRQCGHNVTTYMLDVDPTGPHPDIHPY